MPYRIMQPWGPDKVRQATLVSEHESLGDAFAALDRLTEQAHRTGGRIETIELIVVDSDGRIVSRRNMH